MGAAYMNEELIRQKILNQAKWHLDNWGGKWDPEVDKPSPTKYKVAGKLCADPATRARQGGILISTVFTIAGHPQAPRCLTLSVEAEKMYNRPGGYLPSERNNTDICSWCGIFALYIYKMAGCHKLPGWDDLKVFGVSTVKGTKKLLPKEECHFATSTKPKRGDIGVIGAREVRNSKGEVIIKVGQNHHFIVTDVDGGSVKSIDGNAGNLMEIIDNSYTIPKVLLTGGFYTPIWENCI
jgi:hypothetical protein